MQKRRPGSARIGKYELWVAFELHDRELQDRYERLPDGGFGGPRRDWMVSYRVVPQDGQLVVAEIRIEPGAYTEDELEGRTKPPVPPGGLVAREVRGAIRTGEALDAARDKLRRLYDHAERPAPPNAAFEFTLPEGFAFTREVVDAPPRVGRSGRPDSFYAQYAAAYVDAIANGSKSPVKDVAVQLNEQPEYVRDVLHNARRRGLLTRPPKGRSGGQLTDKARAVLACSGSEKP